MPLPKIPPPGIYDKGLGILVVNNPLLNRPVLLGGGTFVGPIAYVVVIIMVWTRTNLDGLVTAIADVHVFNIKDYGLWDHLYTCYVNHSYMSHNI